MQYPMIAATVTRAADCPPEPHLHIPQPPPPPLNIDKVKEVMLAYHDGDYDGDVAAVFTAARADVEARAGQVNKPALVLDIDETSLSNWPNIKADDFGFIPDGACNRLPIGPCGFKAWILQGVAPPIMPALDLFNAAKANGVAGVFITGRRGRGQEGDTLESPVEKVGAGSATPPPSLPHAHCELPKPT